MKTLQLLTAITTCWLTSGRAEPLPTFRIPRLSERPTIDGTLDVRGWPKHEWSMAVHLSGFGLIHRPRAASTLALAMLGYDRESLYVAVSVTGMDGAETECEATERDTNAWKDESIEIHVGAGMQPQAAYQFVLNADNVIYDAVNPKGGHESFP